jgi:hypothetical protein
MQDSIPYPDQSQTSYPPAQDAYGGYETPNTARPVDTGHGQYPSSPGHYSHGATGMIAAPVPRSMNAQLPDGTPNFALDSLISPTGSGPGHHHSQSFYDTSAQEDRINAPPSYALAADDQAQRGGHPRAPSMDKSGGYFR